MDEKEFLAILRALRTCNAFCCTDREEALIEEYRRLKKAVTSIPLATLFGFEIITNPLLAPGKLYCHPVTLAEGLADRVPLEKAKYAPEGKL